jgi:hypothetical protein
MAAALGVASAATACTTPGGTVEGRTLYQVCGGAPPPPGQDPCQPPTPVRATVSIFRGDSLVTAVRSDEGGAFRVRLAPGAYTATMALDPDGPFVICPQVDLAVPGPPVTLTCRLLAPAPPPPPG